MARSRFAWVSLLPAVWHGGVTGYAKPVAEMELAQAWSVAGPARFDASGLAQRDGELFVVSDRHHDTIFRLVCDGARGEARAEVAVTFAGPAPYPEKGYLDLEGLAPAPDGGFFVAAEWGFAVAHVPADGGPARWVTPDLREAGRAAGLFATPDAYLEGIAVLGDAHFLIAIEREPRGLIEVVGCDPPVRVSAQAMDASRHPITAPRRLDFADLCVWRGRVFALARNQHLVVELTRAADGSWQEGEAWSYAETENAAPHRFVEMKFGQGEGLAIDDAFVHVLIDNNNLARASEPGAEDRRSWLFSFRNPMARERGWHPARRKDSAVAASYSGNIRGPY